jgi:hypothetical protein
VAEHRPPSPEQPEAADKLSATPALFMSYPLTPGFASTALHLAAKPVRPTVPETHRLLQFSDVAADRHHIATRRSSSQMPHQVRASQIELLGSGLSVKT